MRKLLGGISGSREPGLASRPGPSGFDPGRIAKGAGFLLKIYTCHILVFTIGACLGAIEAFIILTAMYGPVSQ